MFVVYGASIPLRLDPLASGLLLFYDNTKQTVSIVTLSLDELPQFADNDLCGHLHLNRASSGKSLKISGR